MNKFLKYTFSFDFFALILFFLIMIPNFIWFLVPAPNDILRAESLTPTIDTISSIMQVIMIIILCFIKNIDAPKMYSLKSPMFLLSVFCLLLYFTSWILYFCGNIQKIIVLGLTLPPCFSFLFYSIFKKNYFATIFCILFTICHFLFALINFF